MGNGAGKGDRRISDSSSISRNDETQPSGSNKRPHRVVQVKPTTETQTIKPEQLPVRK